MGVLQAFFVFLGSLFGMGLAYLTLQPFFDFGLEYMRAMGGYAAGVAGLIDITLKLFPYGFAVAMGIWAFIQSTKEEDNTQWV